MIFDVHTHIYPEAIAARAVAGIGSFYDIAIQMDGRLDTLLAVGAEAGIEGFLVHAVATTPGQIGSLTNFIASCVQAHPGKLVGFTSSHPASQNLDEELETAVKMGLKGIKLHPDFQSFNADCPEAMRIYERMEGRLTLLVHTGDYRTQYSKPARILNIAKAFPKLQIICAHFGGWSEWQAGARVLGQSGVYVDTSSTQYACTPAEVRGLMDAFGTDRLLFGSDYPMWNPVNELEMLDKLFRTQAEREAVLYGNAAKLFGL